MRRVVIWLVFALCAIAPLSARATSTVSLPPLKQNSFASPWGFANTINALQDSANQIAARALKIGNKLLWVLLLIAIAWFGLQVMLGVEAASFEAAVGGFVSQIFIWGLIAWLMKDYVQITQAIISGFGWLSINLTGGSHTIAGYILPGIHLLHMGTVFIDAIHKLPWSTGHFWDMGKNAAQLISSLIAAITILVVSAIMYVAGLVYIGIAILSILLVSIAIALGPIFIPFFVLDFTSFLFDNWFAFLLTAAAYRLVGGVIIAMVEKFTSVISALGGPASILVKTETKPPVYIIALVPALGDILVAVVIVILMLEIPKIASALMGGSGISVSAMRLPRPGRDSDKP